MSSSGPRSPYDAPEPVMRQAGAWLARKDRGFTAREAEEFGAWVLAHPRHAAAVSQLEQTMSTFDRLRELAPPHGGRPDCDVFAPAGSPRRWLAAASIGLAAALTVIVWRTRPALETTTWHYATAAGGYDRATLVDGSTLKLNTDSVVEVEFTQSERRVRLTRGEAHFQVAKDPARPFVVQAGSVSVSAVGTAFNVRLATAGVEVLVTEGKVRVAPPTPAPSPVSNAAPAPARAAEIPLLTAGHKMVVATAAKAEDSKVAIVSPEEMQQALAWQTRVAEFSKTPLSMIVAELNRQNRRQIVIQDPELETLRLGGNFRTDQPEAFVRLLETSFGITVDRAGEVITLRKESVVSP